MTLRRIILLFLLNFSALCVKAQISVSHKNVIVDLIVSEKGRVWIQDISGEIYRLDGTYFVQEKWGGSGWKLWHQILGVPLLSRGQTIYSLDSDRPREIKKFDSDIQFLSFTRTGLCVLDQSLKIHLHNGEEWTTCQLERFDEIKKIYGIYSINDKKLLSNNSHLAEICTEFYSYSSPDFEITGSVLFGNAILLSTKDQGLWTFDNDHFRKFYIPGISFPKNIIKLQMGIDDIWMLSDKKELYAYELEKQTLLKASSNVEHFGNDRWNTIWYTSGNKLYKNISLVNDELPLIEIEAVEVNHKKFDLSDDLSFDRKQNNIAVTCRGIYSPSPEDLTYHFQLSNEGSWNDNGDNSTFQIHDMRPGKHQLSVKTTYDGQYFSKIETLDFNIRGSLFETYWQYLFGLLLALFALAAYSQKRLSERHKALKQERDKMQLEIEVIKQKQKLGQLQLNPHFLFNTLNSISGLIALNDNKSARKYLNEFSQLMRTMLDNSFEDKIQLNQEIIFLEKYLLLEQMINAGKFDYKINNELDESVLMPIMIVQPFLENAILHGIKHKEGKGNILLSFSKKDKNILVKIQDDGIGRKAAEQFRKEGHSSSAIKIVEARLKIMNKWYKDDSIVYEDLVDESGNPEGTIVSLYIPVTF